MALTFHWFLPTYGDSRDERTPLLSRFACFEALRHKFDTAWWEWPEQWRKPDDAACVQLRERYRNPP